MPKTTIWNIEYPLGTQGADVPSVMQTQAQSVETALNKVQAETSGAIELGAIYAPYGYTFDTPGYVIDSKGLVRTVGMIGCSGTAITMTANTQYLVGTMPFGSRPAKDRMFIPATSSAMGGSGRITFRVNGDIHFETSVAFTSVPKSGFFIGIDGHLWDAA